MAVLCGNRARTGGVGPWLQSRCCSVRCPQRICCAGKSVRRGHRTRQRDCRSDARIMRSRSARPSSQLFPERVTLVFRRVPVIALPGHRRTPAACVSIFNEAVYDSRDATTRDEHCDGAAKNISRTSHRIHIARLLSHRSCADLLPRIKRGTAILKLECCREFLKRNGV